MKKIFISTSTFAQFSQEPINILKDNGFEIILNEKGRKLTYEELSGIIYEFEGVIAGTEVYDKPLLEKAEKLKVISRLGVGVDNIDFSILKNKNISLFTTKTTPAPAVAELVIGLILDLQRNISRSNEMLKNGKWVKMMGSLIQSKTLGIIGLGVIGKQLAKTIRGFGLDILAYDISHDVEFSKAHKLKYCDLKTLMSESDIISIHLNLTPSTNKLINKEHLDYMRPNAILINTSRGEILDEEYLFEILKNKKIAGAGLDVFLHEPYNGPLVELDNVVMTPHIASYAKELRLKMEREAVDNLLKGLNE